MKKLLSILAAVGLTATASTAVVACSSTIKAKDTTVSTTQPAEDADYNVTDGSITVTTTKTMKVKMDADYATLNALNTSKTMSVFASSNDKVKKADLDAADAALKGSDEVAQNAWNATEADAQFGFKNGDKLPDGGFKKDKSYNLTVTITISWDATDLNAAGDHTVTLYQATQSTDSKGVTTTDKLTNLGKVKYTVKDAINNFVVNPDGSTTAWFENVNTPKKGDTTVPAASAFTVKDGDAAYSDATFEFTAYKTMGGKDGKSVIDGSTGELIVTIPAQVYNATDASKNTHTFTITNNTTTNDSSFSGTMTVVALPTTDVTNLGAGAVAKDTATTVALTGGTGLDKLSEGTITVTASTVAGVTTDTTVTVATTPAATTATATLTLSTAPTANGTFTITFTPDASKYMGAPITATVTVTGFAA